MDFIIGTTNKAKLRACEEVLKEYFPNSKITGRSVSSDVSDQPFGDEETQFGALNRARNASDSGENTVGIGLEGGVRLINDQLYICNWGALHLPDGTQFTAGGAQILLPDEIARDVQSGKELGPVVDYYFSRKNVRHNEGAIGILTNGAVSRTELFAQILQLLIGQWQYSTVIEQKK
jgi:inosine/xanthosine triphosphatase